jgi:hypothetical protein
VEVTLRIFDTPTGAPHPEKSAGLDTYIGRECPLRRLSFIVAQMITGQTDRCSSLIEKLNPVFRFIVVIRQIAPVGTGVFIDHDLG